MDAGGGGGGGMAEAETAAALAAIEDFELRTAVTGAGALAPKSPPGTFADGVGAAAFAGAGTETGAAVVGVVVVVVEIELERAWKRLRAEEVGALGFCGGGIDALSGREAVAFGAIALSEKRAF